MTDSAVARPILFSGEMVRAILAGRKSQTRRVIKRIVVRLTPQHNPVDCIREEDGVASRLDMAPDDWEICPYGVPGDLLWVREAWRPEELPDDTNEVIGNDEFPSPGLDGIRYRADSGFVAIDNTAEAVARWAALLRPEECYPELREPAWRPSIHMRRWASRLTLRVIQTRVQRVQDITRADAIAEGCNNPHQRAEFRELWDSLNAKRGYGWESNPYVWALTFEAIESNVDEVLA